MKCIQAPVHICGTSSGFIVDKVFHWAWLWNVILYLLIIWNVMLNSIKAKSIWFICLYSIYISSLIKSLNFDGSLWLSTTHSVIFPGPVVLFPSDVFFPPNTNKRKYQLYTILSSTQLCTYGCVWQVLWSGYWNNNRLKHINIEYFTATQLKYKRNISKK